MSTTQQHPPEEPAPPSTQMVGGRCGSSCSESGFFDVPWTDRGKYEWKKSINGNGATIITICHKATGSTVSRCGDVSEAELDDMENALEEILYAQNERSLCRPLFAIALPDTRENLCYLTTGDGDPPRTYTPGLANSYKSTKAAERVIQKMIHRYPMRPRTYLIVPHPANVEWWHRRGKLEFIHGRYRRLPLTACSASWCDWPTQAKTWSLSGGSPKSY